MTEKKPEPDDSLTYSFSIQEDGKMYWNLLGAEDMPILERYRQTIEYIEKHDPDCQRLADELRQMSDEELLEYTLSCEVYLELCISRHDLADLGLCQNELIRRRIEGEYIELRNQRLEKEVKKALNRFSSHEV